MVGVDDGAKYEVFEVSCQVQFAKVCDEVRESQKVVVLGKHLCGFGTDLAISFACALAANGLTLSGAVFATSDPAGACYRIRNDQSFPLAPFGLSSRSEKKIGKIFCGPQRKL